MTRIEALAMVFTSIHLVQSLSPLFNEFVVNWLWSLLLQTNLGQNSMPNLFENTVICEGAAHSPLLGHFLGCSKSSKS